MDGAERSLREVGLKDGARRQSSRGQGQSCRAWRRRIPAICRPCRQWKFVDDLHRKPCQNFRCVRQDDLRHRA